jgi:anti-sigma factor RsiW
MHPEEEHMQQDPYRESLSAWIDGELGRDEARFLARRLESDDDLRATVARYALVGACLRGERVQPVGEDFSARVAARIDAEDAPRSRVRFLRPLVGGAIAAGVAALALMVTGPVRESPAGRAPVAETTAPAVPVLAAPTALRTEDLAAVLPLRQVSETWAMPIPPTAGAMPVEVLDPSVETYFLRHAAGGSASARAGFVPYVNMVAWPAARPAAGVEQGGR